jgi:hypothetical protein
MSSNNRGTYEQVREVLDRMRKFHRRLRDALDEPGSRTKDLRSEYLLGLARREEQEMNQAIARYERDGASAGVLDTWLQYVPDGKAAEELREIDFTPDMTPDEIVEEKDKFDQNLAKFYRQLQVQTSIPRVSELFGQLADMTERRLAKRTWQIHDSDLAPARNGD